MFRISPFLLMLCAVVCHAKPTLEVYDLAPRKEGEELRLVLKLTNTGETDLYLFSEGVADVPYWVRFKQNGYDWDECSHDCGTGARAQRIKAGTYTLVDVTTFPDALASVPVDIRVKLFTDEACTEVVETNALPFTPADFKEKRKPNQPSVPMAPSGPGTP